MKISNILTALDFSDITPRVVDHAVELALAFRAKLWLVHVSIPNPALVGYEASPDAVRDYRAAELRNEHKKLLAIGDDVRGRGLEVSTRLTEGLAVHEILREATRHQVDLIVLGSHGRGAILKMVLGSVSDGVVRKSQLPRAGRTVSGGPIGLGFQHGPRHWRVSGGQSSDVMIHWGPPVGPSVRSWHMSARWH